MRSVIMLTDAEQAEIARHAGHRTNEATAVGDRKRKIYCLECGCIFEAGTVGLESLRGVSERKF